MVAAAVPLLAGAPGWRRSCGVRLDSITGGDTRAG
jgi:hypothetical protein